MMRTATAHQQQLAINARDQVKFKKNRPLFWPVWWKKCFLALSILFILKDLLGQIFKKSRPFLARLGKNVTGSFPATFVKYVFQYIFQHSLLSVTWVWVFVSRKAKTNNTTSTVGYSVNFKLIYLSHKRCPSAIKHSIVVLITPLKYL